MLGFTPYWRVPEIEAAADSEISEAAHSPRLESASLDPQLSHLVLMPPLQDGRKRN